MTALIVKDFWGNDASPPPPKPVEEVWTPAVFDELAALAHYCLTSYAGDRFFGLGNSGSYLAYAVEELARAAGVEQRVGYVPFSGAFMKWSPRSSTSDRWAFAPHVVSDNFKAMRKYKGNYQNLLENVGLHLIQTADLYKKHGLQTTIVDNVQSGESFVSWLYFIHGWGKSLGLSPQILAEAIRPVVLVDDEVSIAFDRNAPPSRIEEDWPGKDFCFYPQQIWISPALRCAMNGNLTQDQERFVPRHPPKTWRTPPHTRGENLEAIAYVKEGICRAIQGPACAYRPRPDSNLCRWSPPAEASAK